MPSDTPTISERIEAQLDTLTRAERQLAQSILENYPISGLGPISALAEAAQVSAPTVARTVQKLGFASYAEFQAELREELQAKVKTPISKHDTWAGRAPSEHLLNRLTGSVLENIRHTLDQIDPDDFDLACKLCADSERHLYIVGGRMTHTLAEYLFLHMQVIRANITHIESTSNAWPHYLLDVQKGDVFLIFDMRRYENNTLKLAEMAHSLGARIILFTDQWRSPVHQIAEVTLSCRIIIPSAWDSAVTPLLLAETLIAIVQNLTWGNSKERVEALEEMFDQTRLFRKFT